VTTRALVISNIFPPSVGGPAVFAHRFAASLQRRGLQVTVVCSVAGRHPPNGGYRLRRLGVTGGTFRREVHRRLGLLAEVALHRLIFCAGLEKETAWACRLLGRGYVLRIGGDVVWEAARNSGLTALEPEDFYANCDPFANPKLGVLARQRSAQFDRAKTVIFVSRYLERLAGHWRVDRSMTEAVVANGVDTVEARKPRQRQRDQLRTVFIGRHVNWKGVDAAILAVSRLDAVSLTIAGAGPMEPAFQNMVSLMGIEDRVRFTGSVDVNNMIGFMNEHDVLLLPSLYEGMSNTLLEAGLAGIACIASDRAGNPEVIEHQATGLLVDPLDVDALGSAIMELQVDETLRLKLARSHQSRILERFSIDHSVQGCIEAAGWKTRAAD